MTSIIIVCFEGDFVLLGGYVATHYYWNFHYCCLFIHFFAVGCGFQPTDYTIAEANTNQQVCIVCNGGTTTQDIVINVVSSGGTATGKKNLMIKL